MLNQSFLWRQKKLFSVRLLFLSLMLSVATVTTILSVSQVLKQSLFSASSQFLAGDRQLSSSREVPEAWIDQAKSLGINTARSVEFATMLRVAGAESSNFQLVAVKAVDGAYPLKGELKIDSKAYPNGSAESTVPPESEIWIQPRLYSLFGLDARADVTDVPELALKIGEHTVNVDGKLLQEPDVGFQMVGLAPRVMMRLDELPLTQVIQPGSRVQWQYYFAGDEDALDAFASWLEPELDPTQSFLGIEGGRPAISEALEKADQYLLLGGSLAVLLAAVAVAISARQFMLEQSQMVAIIKALGGTGKFIVWRYCGELVLACIVLSVAGLVLGNVFSNAWIAGMATQSEYIDASVWILPSTQSIILAVSTALLMLATFALPQLQHLGNTSPMRVLREEQHKESAPTGWIFFMALLGLFSILYSYGRDLELTAIVLGGVAALLCAVALISKFLLQVLVAPIAKSMRLGSTKRYALDTMLRNQLPVVALLAIFGLATYLFGTLLLTRTSLLDQWQSQLPDDSPNHFLINVADYEYEDIKSLLAEGNVQSSGLYPMARGRLSHINGQDVRVAVTKDVAALNRELNLSWTDSLPEDNRIIAGNWWPEMKDLPENSVSIESELAERLGVTIGDVLTFSLGGDQINTVISSLREVQWDSMKPNFYMLFPSDSRIAAFPATYITSFYLPPDQKELLNAVSQQFPTVSILELDQLIEKVQHIVGQVSTMIDLVLVFVLLAALMVLSALVASSRDKRVHEAVLLRTLGASQSFIYRIHIVEFFALGFLAGLLAVATSELTVWVLVRELFAGRFEPNFLVWVSLPLALGSLLAFYAYTLMRGIPKVSPMRILRGS